MGKRQVRIIRKDIFHKKSELEGVAGHVILADHVVHHGQILEITGEKLFLLDPRRHTHSFDLMAIAEVIFDKETDY